MNFPKTLLCGEVHPVSLNFTNMGSSPLHNLKVALSNPKFFTLGDHSDIPKFSGVYHIDNNKSSNCQSCTSADKDFTRLSRVMDINIPGGTLHPKNTVTVPAWVRGNDIGGIHEVNFLFYYEPAQQMPKVRYVFTCSSKVKGKLLKEIILTMKDFSFFTLRASPNPFLPGNL